MPVACTGVLHGNNGQQHNGTVLHLLMSHRLLCVPLRIIYVFVEKLGRVTKPLTLFQLSNQVMHRCASGECIPAMDAVLSFAFPEL